MREAVQVYIDREAHRHHLLHALGTHSLHHSPPLSMAAGSRPRRAIFMISLHDQKRVRLITLVLVHSVPGVTLTQALTLTHTYLHMKNMSIYLMGSSRVLNKKKISHCTCTCKKKKEEKKKKILRKQRNRTIYLPSHHINKTPPSPFFSFFFSSSIQLFIVTARERASIPSHFSLTSHQSRPSSIRRRCGMYLPSPFPLPLLPQIPSKPQPQKSKPEPRNKRKKRNKGPSARHASKLNPKPQASPPTPHLVFALEGLSPIGKMYSGACIRSTSTSLTAGRGAIRSGGLGGEKMGRVGGSGAQNAKRETQSYPRVLVVLLVID